MKKRATKTHSPERLQLMASYDQALNLFALRPDHHHRLVLEKKANALSVYDAKQEVSQ